MKGLNDHALQDVAAYFGALAVPMRLKILNALREGERNVTDLTEEFGCSQANVSKHLSVLAHGGLIEKVPRGTSAFYRFSQPGLRGHTTAADEIRAGADVLTFSGDKLLGSVQAGLVAGKAAPLAAMAKHPLYRSLRVDKVRLALLEGALLRYLDIGSLRQHNLTVDLLERTVAEMEPLARTLLAGLGAASPGGVTWELVRDASLAGGGAAPEARLETLCLALASPAAEATRLAAQLREGEPPIVARIHDGRVLLDLRTLLPADLPEVVRQVRALVP